MAAEIRTLFPVVKECIARPKRGVKAQSSTYPAEVRGDSSLRFCANSETLSQGNAHGHWNRPHSLRVPDLRRGLFRRGTLPHEMPAVQSMVITLAPTVVILDHCGF
jgi:hypothetical protein